MNKDLENIVSNNNISNNDSLKYSKKDTQNNFY